MSDAVAVTSSNANVRRDTPTGQFKRVSNKVHHRSVRLNARYPRKHLNVVPGNPQPLTGDTEPRGFDSCQLVWITCYIAKILSGRNSLGKKHFGRVVAGCTWS